jgi:hypothetical protein
MILKQDTTPKFAFEIHVIVQMIRIYCSYCTSGGHNGYSLPFMRFLISTVFVDNCGHDGVSGPIRSHNNVNVLLHMCIFTFVGD